MAVATKTLTPTGQVVSLPDMTEKPNASVLVDGIGKDADAINALDNNRLKFIEGNAKTVGETTWTTADGVANVILDVSPIITPSRVKMILSVGIGINPAGVFMSVAQGYDASTQRHNCYIRAQNEQTVPDDTSVYVKLLYV